MSYLEIRQIKCFLMQINVCPSRKSNHYAQKMPQQNRNVISSLLMLCLFPPPHPRRLPHHQSQRRTPSPDLKTGQERKIAWIVSSYRKHQISNSSKYTQISVLTDPIEVMFYKNTVISRGTSKAATKESEALHAEQKIIPPGTNPKSTTGSSLPDQFVAFIWSFQSENTVNRCRNTKSCTTLETLEVSAYLLVSWRSSRQKCFRQVQKHQ